MSKVDAYKCDGCRKVFESRGELQALKLESNGWLSNGVDRAYHPESELEFCRPCRYNLIETLKKILTRLDETTK